MIKKHIDYSLSQFYRIKYKFIRFLFVGVINSLFSLTVYWILVFIGVHYSLALFISSILGILFNYKTTGKLVFENSSNRMVFKFFAVYLFSYFLSLGGVKLLLMIGFNKYNAPVITAIPMAVISFILSKKFVFNKSEKQSLL
ncbi:MAG: GtrA family protein [Bacteroidales bacterium]